MPTSVRTKTDIKPGDIYENCHFQPCLCIGVEDVYKDTEVFGISLVDGSYPHCCSIAHCAIRKLTPVEAYNWRINGPEDAVLLPQEKWW